MEVLWPPWPPGLAKRMVFQWFWRAPAPQKLKFNEIQWSSMKIMELHEIYWNFMKFHEVRIFWWNGGLYAPMVESVDIPKGFLVVFEVPWTPKCGKSQNSWFYCKLPQFSDFPFLHKMLGTCHFPHFGVQGTSKTTDNPWGLLVASAMGAKRPPFYQKGGNFIKCN